MKLNIFGTEAYLRMKPTFPGSKAPVPCAMPSTARLPTSGQKAARKWLITNAHGLVGTFGAVPDAGNGKGGTALGLELHKKAPGVGAHVAGWRTAHYGAISKRKSEAHITNALARLG